VRSFERGHVRHRAEVPRAQTRVVVPASGVSARQVRVAVREPAVVAAPNTRRARPGDRVHVVFAGESLWSIASDVLGPRATVAKVAREVNRLWELNRARIGTGDRDLLPVGTRLELK
jgi:nucleoid-associated protein YgaU